MRTIIILASIFAILFVINFYDETLHPAGLSKEGGMEGKAAIGGPFTLTDTNGNTVAEQDFRGKLMLVYFGFTYCPAICPTDLAIMTKTIYLLGDDAEKIAPIFITVDPERDTQEQIKSYLSSFSPRIIGLTGNEKQLQEAYDSYRVYRSKIENEMMEEYMIDHSAFIYLMDKDGNYLTHFPHNTKPEEIKARIESYLKG
jgi:protein SCO1/2